MLGGCILVYWLIFAQSQQQKARATSKNTVITWKGFLILSLFICSDTDIMSQSVDVLKDIISAHDIDSRFDSQECRSRIAALYLPLMAIAMEALPMLHGYESEKDDLINENVAMAIATSSVLQKQSSPDLTSVSSAVSLKIPDVCFIFSIQNDLSEKSH